MTKLQCCTVQYGMVPVPVGPAGYLVLVPVLWISSLLCKDVAVVKAESRDATSPRRGEAFCQNCVQYTSSKPRDIEGKYLQ